MEIIVEEPIIRIKSLLIEKAARRSAIHYSAIYRYFEDTVSNFTVWKTFEEACRRIAPAEVALYGALMAKKGNNLPGDGFFDAYKNTRRNEYLEITEGQMIESNTLSPHQMQIIAQVERERVHIHARNIISLLCPSYRNMRACDVIAIQGKYRCVRESENGVVRLEL